MFTETPRQLSSSKWVLTMAGLIFWLGVILTASGWHAAEASIEVSYAYQLSNFSGTVPYNWVNLVVDELRNEIYVLDPSAGDIRVFNAKGMEIFSFGEDGSLDSVADVTVEKGGDILVLSKTSTGFSILRCNFRGEVTGKIILGNLPDWLSNFSPTRLIHRNEKIYLLDTTAMKLAVTAPDGIFQNGFDLMALLEIPLDKQIGTEVNGFYVDGNGNMLFTVPVLFSAYILSPEGRINGFGTPGSSPGRFGVVSGIAADDKGNIFVADRLRSVVMIFDRNFQFLKEFGYRGLLPSNLISPSNLALDGQGKLYVSQLKNRGVGVFKIQQTAPDLQAD